MAVTDIGLSPQEFWGLTWYDWGMYVLKDYKQKLRRQEEHEMFLAVMRLVIADFRNVHFKEKVRPQDIFSLSFDKKLEQEKTDRAMTFEEAKRQLGSKLKRDVK